MIHLKQRNKAEQFQQLHHEKDILLLPNAWDALSAKLYERAGAKAVGTTSAGIAAMLGFPDGQCMPKDLLLTIVERIITAVSLPVTVDLEAGYVATFEEICDIIQDIIDLGAVGINIEDTDFSTTNQLVTADYQKEKIRAIRHRADKNAFPLFINARSDVFWLNGEKSTHEKLTETIQRLSAYSEAGADGIFVPGIKDIDTISNLCLAINLPLNVLGGSCASSLAELKLAGVSRLSIGSGIFRATAAFIKQTSHQFLTENSLQFLEGSIPYDTVCKMFS